MMNLINNKKSILIIGIAISALLPMLIIAYELITTDKESISFTFDSIIGLLIILYYLLLIIAGFAAIVYWIVKQIKAIAQLKNERTKAELKQLKAQVNPHFFFNMLNNLYGWVDKDAGKAKELILKLSEMMRYSIYEGQKDKVLLKDEIQFLNNFIELHKMRYHKNIDIDFEIIIKTENTKVMPLLFIILLENAFKHGVETQRNNAFVHLKLKADETGIYFEVKNNFEEEEKGTAGIGLSNLKRRLELAYPKHYQLTTSCKNNVYIAKLNLKL